MSRAVDLNCDLGELADGALDAEVMPFITSANVACGGHAGDVATMRRTVRLARRHGVAVGAHPGLADRDGFGRRETEVVPAAVRELVLHQVRSLGEIAAGEGVVLSHVKPHGALYNRACRDGALASAVLDAVREVTPDVIVFGLPGSALERAARDAGLRFGAEGFADRGYRADGSLVPRGESGAFVTGAEAAERAVAMVLERRVRAVSGEWIALAVDTVCVHGDNPEAVALVRAIREALADAGIAVCRPGIP